MNLIITLLFLFRKLIEKAFRKNALKCHPDKGGDPIVFKKLNDAYYKLIGHVHKVSIDLHTYFKSNIIQAQN